MERIWRNSEAMNREIRHLRDRKVHYARGGQSLPR